MTTSLLQKLQEEYGKNTFLPISEWKSTMVKETRYIGIYQHQQSKLFFLFLETEGKSLHVADNAFCEEIQELAEACAEIAQAEQVEKDG